MFIGRSAELKQMSRLYANNDFQCIIIWGRRRVGKTTLINQFIKDKPTVYFTATESTARIISKLSVKALVLSLIILSIILLFTKITRMP